MASRRDLNAGSTQARATTFAPSAGVREIQDLDLTPDLVRPSINRFSISSSRTAVSMTS